MADRKLNEVEALASFDKVLALKGSQVGSITADALKNWGGVFVFKRAEGVARRLATDNTWYHHYAALIYAISPASQEGALMAITWKPGSAPKVKLLCGYLGDRFGIYYDTRENQAEHELWFKFENSYEDGNLIVHHIYTYTTNDHMAQSDVPGELTKATIL